jgi:hypothetical protein
MQNAHERFGALEFTKHRKDTTTRVRVYTDRAVLEPAKGENGQASAHLISLIGGDSEIGALWAAITAAALLQIHLCYRLSLFLLASFLLCRTMEGKPCHYLRISTNICVRAPPNWPKGFFGRIHRSTGSMTRHHRSLDIFSVSPFRPKLSR